MKCSKLLLSLVLVVSSFSSTSVFAQVISSGSACHSITPSQATKFEWRAEGIKNGDSQNNWWVNCPFQRPPGRSELTLSLRVANTTDSNIPIECNFREMYEGKRLQGKPVSSDVPGGETRTLTWTMQPKQASSVTNAACKLPDGLQIEGSIADYSGRGTNQDVEGFWAVTFGTGFDGWEWYIAQFDANSGVEFLGRGSAVSGSISGVGEYNLYEDCSIEGELASNLGDTIYFMGFLAKDKLAIQGVTSNSGFYAGANLTKIAPLSTTTLQAMAERIWTP